MSKIIESRGVRFAAKLHVRSSLSALIVAMGAWHGTALAQETETTAQEVATDSTTANTTGDIVVTARQRGERLMDVPVVLTAISSESLAKGNITTLEGMASLTPTLIVSNYKFNGGGSLAIRGISSPANQLGFEQAVSVAVDGIQSSNGQIAQLGFFDLAQVEVLKGPQALFFGKNNTAGVISITTAGPTDSFEASLKTGYEFVAREFTTEGVLSGPVTDTLGVRLAVRYRDMEGWLKNTASASANPFYQPATGAPASVGLLTGRSSDRLGEKEILGRLTVAYEPSRDFKAVARVAMNHGTDNNAGGTSQNIGPCADGFPRVYGNIDYSADCKADNRATVGNIPAAIAATFPRKINADGSPSGELNAILASLSLDWNLGAFAIASRTAYSKLRYELFTGGDQTAFSQFAVYEDQSQRDISQEIRLSSQFDGSLNFVAGGFYQNTKRYVYADVKLNDGHYNAAVNRYDLFNSETFNPGETFSLFGQAIWKVVPELELAAGVRWTKEKKRYRKYNLYGFGSFDTSQTMFPGETELGVMTGKFRDENVSPEVTLTWHPNSDHTIFAAYRSGFKSGGFGLTNPLQKTSTISGNDFGSETAKGFEIGARGEYLNRRLNVSVAAFAYDFSDLQVNIYDPTRVAYSINNAGKVRQRGAEMDFNFRVTPAFTLNGALTYVSNKFKDFVGQCYSYSFPTGTTRDTAVPPPNCSFVNSTSLTLQQDFNNRTPARSPNWSGNAGFDYVVPVGDLDLTLSGNATYSGAYFAADTLVDASYQKAYWTLNASATLAKEDQWKISLIGRNLSNEYPVLYAVDRSGGTGVPGAIGEQRGVIGRGRQVALQMQVNF